MIFDRDKSEPRGGKNAIRNSLHCTREEKKPTLDEVRFVLSKTTDPLFRFIRAEHTETNTYFIRTPIRNRKTIAVTSVFDVRDPILCLTGTVPRLYYMYKDYNPCIVLGTHLF